MHPMRGGVEAGRQGHGCTSVVARLPTIPAGMCVNHLSDLTGPDSARAIELALIVNRVARATRAEQSLKPGLLWLLGVRSIEWLDLTA